MYIGSKKIENTKVDKSLDGLEVVVVEYEDGLKDVFSKLMYDNIASEQPCDATLLREKRVEPVVKEVLTVLRNWGIKMGELQYFSVVLNTSLQQNENEALKRLWQPYIPTLKELDDIDLIAVDRVLKTKTNG